MKKTPYKKNVMKLNDLKKGDKFRFIGNQTVFVVENTTSRRFQYGNLKDTIVLSRIKPPDTLNREVELISDQKTVCEFDVLQESHVLVHDIDFYLTKGDIKKTKELLNQLDILLHNSISQKN